MKATLLDELELMKLSDTVYRCKKLVTFLKQSDLLQRLGGKTVKQEIDVRWNSVVVMLESIDDAWDEVRRNYFVHYRSALNIRFRLPR